MGKTFTAMTILCAWLAYPSHGQEKDGEPRQRSRGRNPLVRVVTISQDQLPRESAKRLVEETFARLNQAASFEPDIVCLPEICNGGEAEEATGPTIERAAEWARRHRCYVICPIRVRVGQQVFNSAVLIDREGRIVGRYDKIHPTEGELKGGTLPGSIDPPVFQTDFGTIGIQICFDVNWHDSWSALKKKGAQIIFFPSAFPAARQTSALAWMNQVYVVSSTISGPSRIHDVSGEALEVSGRYRHWAGAVLPLGKRLCEIDFNISKARQAVKKYGDRVHVRWHHEDDLFTIASLDPEVTTEEIIREFGITPLNPYLARCQKAQDEARRQVVPEQR